MAQAGNRRAKKRATKSLTTGGLPTLAEFANTRTIDPWQLTDPDLSYRASLAGVTRSASSIDFHFALALPMGRIINAVSVRLPRTYEADFVQSLDAIRERLAQASERGTLETLEPLDLGLLNDLDADSYTCKAADFCRATTNDHTTVLDFFWLPPVPEARIQARPQDKLRVDSVLRVVLDASTFKCLVDELQGSDEDQ